MMGLLGTFIGFGACTGQGFVHPWRQAMLRMPPELGQSAEHAGHAQDLGTKFKTST